MTISNPHNVKYVCNTHLRRSIAFTYIEFRSRISITIKNWKYDSDEFLILWLKLQQNNILIKEYFFLDFSERFFNLEAHWLSMPFFKSLTRFFRSFPKLNSKHSREKFQTKTSRNSRIHSPTTYCDANKEEL